MPRLGLHMKGSYALRAIEIRASGFRSRAQRVLLGRRRDPGRPRARRRDTARHRVPPALALLRSASPHQKYLRKRLHTPTKGLGSSRDRKSALADFDLAHNAGGRTRTSKDLTAQRDLNPPRLPVPPRPRRVSSVGRSVGRGLPRPRFAQDRDLLAQTPSHKNPWSGRFPAGRFLSPQPSSLDG